MHLRVRVRVCLFMCLPAYVLVSVCVCIRVCTRLYVCMCACACVCLCRSMCAYVCVHMHVRARVYLCVGCVRAYVCACVCVHMCVCDGVWYAQGYFAVSYGQIYCHMLLLYVVVRCSLLFRCIVLEDISACETRNLVFAVSLLTVCLRTLSVWVVSPEFPCLFLPDNVMSPVNT